MCYINIPKVRGKMVERGYTVCALSKKLDICRNTLYTYLEKPEKMPYEIVAHMADLLCDTREEAAAIFFASDDCKPDVSLQLNKRRAYITGWNAKTI